MIDINRYKYSRDVVAINDCVRGGTYYVAGRYLTIGVWDPDQLGFVGLRVADPAQDERALVCEPHIGVGMFARGSAKPRGLLEPCPVLAIASILLRCHYCDRQVYYNAQVPPLGGLGGQSRYVHLADDSPICDYVHARPNHDLVVYLQECEHRYLGQENLL